MSVRLPLMRGIHLKLISTVVVAGLVPLLLGLASLNFFGRKLFLSQRGDLFQTAAEYTAEGLGDGLLGQSEELVGWVSLSPLAGQLARQNDRVKGSLDAEQIQDVERAWASARIEDPLVHAMLTHEMVESLNRFRLLDSLLEELLVTDRVGRIVAGTNKSSDFWQADETWWTRASTLPPAEAWIGGIDYDDSAGVYAISVAIPIHNSGGFEGVLKAVINASPLLNSIAPPWKDHGPVREIVKEDGEVLARLDRGGVNPLDARFGSIPEGLNGSTVWETEEGERVLIGYAQVACTKWLPVQGVLSEVRPMVVVVHQPLNVVMAPLNHLLARVSMAGVTMVAVFGLIGFYVASRKLVRPIGTLRAAAREIAETANLDLGKDVREDLGSRRRAEERLAAVERIQTGDELQVLAKDFGLMSRRVLDYHEQMEREISCKTEEIQQDLIMARHFQEALLPEFIPPVPSKTTGEHFQLNFSHVYKPALSVSGDFFDVHNLGESTAGVFIADVMGHGARSALVTAILYTMLQGLEQKVQDPARLLELINQRFSSIAVRTDEMLFVTAFYMLLDTRTGTMHYASAGHPAPLVVSRSKHSVRPLLNEGEFGSGLGLQPDGQYTFRSAPLVDGDSIVLFTDGVTEAMSPQGEEFGEERLSEILLNAIDRGGESDLTQVVVAELHSFMNTELAQDDICIVSAEIRAVE